MGWSKGYETMEAAVVAAYNTGKLTPEQLDKIMEPYKGTDCDSGGSNNLKSTDGLGVEEIICKIMKPQEYEDVIQNPVYYEDEEPSWNSNEKAYDLFSSIWSGIWKMW